MKIKLWTDPMFGGFYVSLYTEHDGKIWCVKPIQLELKKHEDFEAEEPTFKMNMLEGKEFLQSISDETHNLGIKPFAAPILENELTAVKYHLEDMRKLVFKIDN